MTGAARADSLPNSYITEGLIMAMATDELDRTFAALADPTRRAILARLAAGEASVGELAAPFEMSLPAVSKHLKVLERAGLIARGRERQRRPARLEADRLREVAEWAEQYRRFWEESYDRLEEYLEELQDDRKEKRDGRKRKQADGDDADGSRDRDHARPQRAARPRVRGA